MSNRQMKITRCPENPVVQPGLYEWRMAATLNPAALYEEGKFYLYRARREVCGLSTATSAFWRAMTASIFATSLTIP